MTEQALKDKKAIVVVDWTAFTKSSGTNVVDLVPEASLQAMVDAGPSRPTSTVSPRSGKLTR